jgi:hypothetical protein
MTDPRPSLKKLVETARQWAVLRGRYRKLLDSKTADEKEVEKVKKALLKATDRLERAVIVFDKTYRRFLAGGKDLKKQGGPFPWKELLGVVAAGASALDKAVSQPPPTVPQDVIDVEAEVVK